MEEVTRWYNRVDTMQLYQLHYRLCALIAEWGPGTILHRG